MWQRISITAKILYMVFLYSVAPHMSWEGLYLLYIHYPPLENLPLEKHDLQKIFYQGYDGIRQWPIN